ncbi:MAG: PDZ domain-containing protein [Sedimentisphaerales bacterium]|nr:PDZ domain-containing protein [Sedimentisphaerales bacterium]
MENRSKALLIVTTALVLSAGCQTINKGITESVLDRREPKRWQVHYGSRVHYLLDNHTMKEVELEGELTVGGTTVHYQRGLAEQANCVADKTADLAARVQQRTGVTISTHSMIYLLRFDDGPQDFDVMLDVDPNQLPLPLFVQAGNESCESIFIQNRGYPYMLFHELVETSLAAGRKKGLVLPDPSWGVLGLAIHVNNYTRWFREGVANYAGYVAYQALSEDIPSSHRLQYRQTLLHTNPFSSLVQIGDKLFSWKQSSRTRHERTYYNAALGLFLLIEDAHGPDAIRRIMEEIATHETVDGRDLLKITQGMLGVDIRQLARDFTFPLIGAELERLTPAMALNGGIEIRQGLLVQTVEKDSLAAQAGLQEKDVITAVGTAPMANGLDFELALFKARNQPSVTLAVERKEAGTVTLQLAMRKPASSDQTGPQIEKPAKPSKKGRIESTSSPLLFAF